MKKTTQVGTSILPPGALAKLQKDGKILAGSSKDINPKRMLKTDTKPVKKTSFFDKLFK